MANLKNRINTESLDMPQSLYLFNDSITKRYNTLETNIKSKSNSFYDSYLDLVEETFHYILQRAEVSHNPKWTCGTMLRDSNVKYFIFNELRISESQYDLLLQHIVTANTHKHDAEKNVTIESIIPMLNTYFDVINCFNNFINASIIVLDVEYIKSIYGENEKVKKDLSEMNEKMERFGATMEEMAMKMDSMSATINDLKEKNSRYEAAQKDSINTQRAKTNPAPQRPANPILPTSTQVQNFFKNAYKEYVWIGPMSIFRDEKRKITIAYIVSMVACLLATILSSCAFGLYSTFTIFENIWLITTIVMFVRHLKRNDRVEHTKLAKSFRSKYVKGEHDLMARTPKTKIWHKIVQIALIVSCICNIICYWVPNTSWEYNSNAVKAFALIFELSVIVSSIVLNISQITFEIDMSSVAAYTNYKIGSKQKVTIYENINLKQYITQEEFDRRFANRRKM